MLINNGMDEFKEKNEELFNKIRINKIRYKYAQINNEKKQDDKIKKKYAQSSKQNLQDNNIQLNYYKLIKEKPIYRIINSLSTRIRNEFARLGIKRTFKYTDVLGCSITEFEEYLLKNMKDGMSFDNYGEWEVDHIIPFSHFNFHIFSDIITCCDYQNLQPLWKIENRQKYNKIQ